MRRKLLRFKRQVGSIQRQQARKLLKAQRKQARQLKRIRRHPFVWPAVFLMFLIGGFAAFVVSPSGRAIGPAGTRIVIISHDGKRETVPTKESTVGALLQKLAIPINQGDVVEPSVDTQITQDDFRINIYRSQPVEIVDGLNRTFSQSAATTARAVAQQAGVTVYPEDNLSEEPTTNFLMDGSIGERIVIDRATPVNVNVYGTPTIIRTRAQTVGDLLQAEHIVLASGDTVSPDPSTILTPNSTVYLDHEGTQIATVTTAIPMPIQTIEDSSLAYGTSAIRQQGSNGSEIQTFQLNLVNGQEVSRTLLQNVVTQQPVTEIVAQGTNLSGIKGDMALAGIAPQDYQYADYIISHESGWCTTKAQGEHYCPAIPDNQFTYGGYGLCQATPGSKMASAGADWATNPITQLVWCNGYAVSRYGGWYQAYVHWTAYGNW